MKTLQSNNRVNRMSCYINTGIWLHLLIWTLVPIAGYASGAKHTLASVKRTIAYIYQGAADPCKERLSPIGTGFFAGFSDVPQQDGTKRTLLFLVTNKHVIAERSEIVVRIEGADGKPECVSVPLRRDGEQKNVTPARESGVDLVAINIGPTVTKVTGFDYNMLIDNRVLKAFEIEEGTEVITLGFMLKNPGFEHNYPTVRFGKVASLNSERWYSGYTKTDEQAYVVDCNLTFGTSGSPVILNPEQMRVTEDNKFQHRRVPVLLLGVVKGGPATSADLKDVPSLKVKLSQGVTAVEPASNLKGLLREIAEELSKLGYKVELREPKLPE